MARPEVTTPPADGAESEGLCQLPPTILSPKALKRAGVSNRNTPRGRKETQGRWGQQMRAGFKAS